LSQAEVVVDATDQMMGRLASKVAKLLLQGHRVVVVNSEKALLSEKKRTTIEEIVAFRQTKGRVHYKHTPRHPKTPSGFLTKVIRGMLGRRKSSSLAMFKNLRVYEGVPRSYTRAPKISFEEAKPRKSLEYYARLGEVLKILGWKG